MRILAMFAAFSLLTASSALAQEAAGTDPYGAPQPEDQLGGTATETQGEATDPGGEAQPTDAATDGTTELTAAPAETPPPATEAEAAPAAPEDAGVDEPSDLERMIVTGVAGGVAVAGLVTGIVFGVLAMQEFNCLDDAQCVADRGADLEGEKYRDARADVERMALYADMGYLVAVTAATVAIVGGVELLLGSGSEAAE